MSNWFSSLPSGLNEGLNDLTKKVQAAIPIDAETIQKLTLNTPELQAERQAMDAEYKHKVAVKDSLAHMYPWDTRDSERDILVEECKEQIMNLSSDVETFFGPYPMPKLNVNTEEEKTEEEELLAEEEENEEDVKDKKPSKASLEKLAKLEPLPPLLSDFDLHAHVGLIQKMLQADPTLVEKQSSLSGGGDREKVFWRNYFFHCAFTRYEAGLSIDEIWSDQPPPPPPPTSDGKEVAEEETVDFEAKPESSSAPPLTTQAFDVATTPPSTKPPSVDVSSKSSSPTSTEFEIVDAAAVEDDAGGLDDEEDAFAGEMDELEAEIARELED